MNEQLMNEQIEISETKLRKMYYNTKIWRATLSAFKDGTLQAKPCKVCGKMESGPHHHDYNKPFNIIWLCEEHKNHVHFEASKTFAAKRRKPNNVIDYLKSFTNIDTDTELGKMLGYKQSYISKLRTGRGRVSIKFLLQASKTFGIPTETVVRLMKEIEELTEK